MMSSDVTQVKGASAHARTRMWNFSGHRPLMGTPPSRCATISLSSGPSYAPKSTVSTACTGTSAMRAFRTRACIAGGQPCNRMETQPDTGYLVPPCLQSAAGMTSTRAVAMPSERAGGRGRLGSWN